MNQASSLIDKYFIPWALVMPVTSVLVVPSIQGTTAGYLMCFLSLPLVLAYGGAGRVRYLSFVFTALVAWTIILLLSQLADATVSYEPNLGKVALVDFKDVETFVIEDREPVRVDNNRLAVERT